MSINEDYTVQLEEVFSGLKLKTKEGEEIFICMRDSGFEFTYQDITYSAKLGVLKKGL